MNLTAAIPACKTDLGPFVKDQVSECLSTSITPISWGSNIVNCLKNTVKDLCLRGLPRACTDLSGVSGTDLDSKIPQCKVALGPFAASDTLGCLTSGPTQGDAIIYCLTKHTGLPNLSNLCPVATVPYLGCLSQLPPACDTLKDTNGLDLVPLLPTCRAAFGNYGTGHVAQCLDPYSDSFAFKGADVVACLKEYVSKICLSTLPPTCTSLDGLTATDLPGRTPQCITDLGPFASGGVKKCEGTSTSGESFLNCIKTAISGGGGSGRVAGSVVPGATITAGVQPTPIPGLDIPIVHGHGGHGHGGHGNGGGYGYGYGYGSDGSGYGYGRPRNGYGSNRPGHGQDSEFLPGLDVGADPASPDFWKKVEDWIMHRWLRGAEKGAGKGVEKGAEKGAEKSAEKGAEKGVEKGAKARRRFAPENR
ncbi:hypothetical protein E4U35_006765 [Claviceps purpurea]|nr:hypothetical protein E4U35_006765 [Claviceps purpurea]KAG6223236.1 hypothetical protein E4U25_000283 [Claviceps purpurea]KAG6274298.1 hypothetical protein E4U47_001571 [Claviceps purpurea]KAG6281953.1 hypothetical protein E4U48_005694 [Claviceps purpurea]KAG6309992.1 hypothetical protein E4U44_006133 [Claviceps purpurea]